MKTPIYDFVNEYANRDGIRMHMPGHKGAGDIEKYDITEISGADSLYEADGIIKESEKNASMLFGADTFYSAEGSSLSIRAMIRLITLYAKERGAEPIILASRNAHKTFVSAIALTDARVEWLFGNGESYLSASVTASDVERAILSLPEPPTAVYLTSPDYLGSTLDIAAISKVCKRYGVLLAVDNAHGAYLKFLEKSLHPIDLGADICCDSAHKTLPCLTGAAYLHISRSAPRVLLENARDALALFGSTSPSYLILASLDRANEYLAQRFSSELASLTEKLQKIKSTLSSLGYLLYGDEPMKITVVTKPYGYYGYELAEKLSSFGIVHEFADRDFLTLMPSTKTTDNELSRILDAFRSIEMRAPIDEDPPKRAKPKTAMTPREAIFSSTEEIVTEEAEGRVLGAITVGCPPAVPIVVSGEIVDKNAVRVFEYYGIKKIKVVKK